MLKCSEPPQEEHDHGSADPRRAPAMDPPRVLRTISNKSTRAMMVQQAKKKVAVIGGGITGASVASHLVRLATDADIQVDVFDQGRSGVGGRMSHRRTTTKGRNTMRWDHGCQFFRADTDRFRSMVDRWVEQGVAAAWTPASPASFVGEDGAPDFFGLPHSPPFFVGVDGMDTVVKRLLEQPTPIEVKGKKDRSGITVFEQHRVASMKQQGDDNTWTLWGTSGAPAFHDTPEKQVATQPTLFGQGYDFVVLTDVSSSFSSWHRASAGVPESFAQRVRAAVGERVPLFTCLLAFATPLPVPTSAATLMDETVWFAARSNHKPDLLQDTDDLDCWTIVSTPQFALRMIEATPMQDPNTGAFIPQSQDYLSTVPGPQLQAAFLRLVQQGRLGKITTKDPLPPPVYMTAQRWGSALPGRRCDNITPNETLLLSGVSYATTTPTPLAPTQRVVDDRPHSFIADTSLRLIQAGDMVSTYTPGVEGAVLSGLDAAEYVVKQVLEESNTTDGAKSKEDI